MMGAGTRFGAAILSAMVGLGPAMACDHAAQDWQPDLRAVFVGDLVAEPGDTRQLTFAVHGTFHGEARAQWAVPVDLIAPGNSDAAELDIYASEDRLLLVALVGEGPKLASLPCGHGPWVLPFLSDESMEMMRAIGVRLDVP